jgi:hypothetical protein
MSVQITNSDAVEALLAAAHTVDDPESSDNGRTLIHCGMGGAGLFIGADWDVDDAKRTIERADVCHWSKHIFGHELAVVADGKLYRFDVRAPEGTL